MTNLYVQERDNNGTCNHAFIPSHPFLSYRYLTRSKSLATQYPLSLSVFKQFHNSNKGLMNAHHHWKLNEVLMNSHLLNARWCIVLSSPWIIKKYQVIPKIELQRFNLTTYGEMQHKKTKKEIKPSSKINFIVHIRI